MAFGLTIGTERAAALQNAIQDELTARGYSPDADPVMAEYITIMIINNKTPAQITAELQELIGPDFDSSFVDWLFEEAAKGSSEAEAAPATPLAVTAPAASTNVAPLPSAPQNTLPVAPSQPPQAQGQPLPHRRPGPSGLYQHALSSLPGVGTGSKRTRSPSPGGHANKSRRTNDLPTGPRAMGGGGRSLLDRMGGRPGYAKDDIQARIDNITGGGAGEGFPGGMGMNGPPMNGPMGMNGPVGMNGMPMGVNGMSPMDMNMMAAAAAAQGGMGMANPMMLQEMMMNQMALMAQMAGAMGMLPPPQQGQSPQPQQGQFGEMNGDRGRGGMRGRGRGRGGPGGGRGGHNGGPPPPTQSFNNAEAPAEASTPLIHAPAPTPAAAHPHPAQQQQQPQYPRQTPPTRPLSPSLCKFGWKCTNASCRWSHPSPVSTAESGVVLSNDACEKGVACKDKDCVKAHVSPAAARLHTGGGVANGTTSTPTTPSIPPPATTSTPTLNPSAQAFTPSSSTPPTSTSASTSHMATIPCRFGNSCTRPGCAYMHPAGHPLHRPHSYNASSGKGQVPCRFGVACTRAGCPFAHPEGRGVLPGTFHRGLGIDNVATEGKNRSVTFNTAKPAAAAADGVAKEKETAAADGQTKEAADLERRVKEVEEMKIAVQNALKEKEEARRKVGVAANGA